MDESFVVSKYLSGVFLTQSDYLGGVEVFRAIYIIDCNKIKA